MAVKHASAYLVRRSYVSGVWLVEERIPLTTFDPFEEARRAMRRRLREREYHRRTRAEARRATTPRGVREE